MEKYKYFFNFNSFCLQFNTLFDLLDFEYTQIQNLHGINLSVKILKIQIMIIYMVVVFSHAYVIMHEYFGKK
jgi:hypothetical protein